MGHGTYTLPLEEVTISGAGCIMQLQCGTDMTAELLRCWVHNTDVETSQQLGVTINRKSSVATGLTNVTPMKHSPGQATTNALTGGGNTTGVTDNDLSAEGTDTDIFPYGTNVLNGWEWVPTPLESIYLGPSDIIQVVFTAAPTSAVFSGGITFHEIAGA